MCVQKVAGASPDRWDHGAPTGQRGPLVEGIMCLFTLPSRPAACASRSTLPSSMTTRWTASRADTEHEVPGA